MEGRRGRKRPLSDQISQSRPKITPERPKTASSIPVRETEVESPKTVAATTKHHRRGGVGREKSTGTKQAAERVADRKAEKGKKDVKVRLSPFWEKGNSTCEK